MKTVEYTELSPLYKKWGMFEQIIELRNKLIHENERINIKSKRVRKNLLNTIYDVIYLTGEELREAPYYDEQTFEKNHTRILITIHTKIND